MAKSGEQQDRWADWLTKGRQRGMDDRQVRAMNRYLNRVAKRVLKDAKVRQGDRVLDVGAGTGLLALEARRRTKDTGLVVASDISHDALRHCRAAASEGSDGAPVLTTVGDSTALPFPDETFDVVMTRSVLIYLTDKPRGVRELYRVLKPGGRASIFEPINEVWRRHVERLSADGTYDAFQPTYDQINNHFRASRSSTFLGWDERDLVGWFEEAGFSQVGLTYEHSSWRRPVPKRVTEAARRRLRNQWKARPNPHDPSLEELVTSLLGDEADDYLERYLEFSLTQSPPSASGVAYLSAKR